MRLILLFAQPFLKVNLNGKRFCNESGPYDYMLHSAFMQPYHAYVDIAASLAAVGRS